MKKALLSRCVFQDANDRRAKDGETELAMSERMVGVESVVGSRIACSQPVATASAACGHSLCPRPSHRHHLAPRRRGQRRLPRLLLLPGGTRTQDQIRRHPVAASGAADLAASGSAPGGHRRHAHQAVRPEGRRGRYPPQPHAGPGRPKVSLRTYLGDPLAGRAASAFRGFGPAALGDALCPPQNDGQDSQVAGLDVCHQARAGRPAGRVDRSDRQTSRENAVDRRRWRLREGPLLETAPCVPG